MLDDLRRGIFTELSSGSPTIDAYIPRAGDRATQLHLQGAVHRIDDVLEPKK